MAVILSIPQGSLTFTMNGAIPEERQLLVELVELGISDFCSLQANWQFNIYVKGSNNKVEETHLLPFLIAPTRGCSHRLKQVAHGSYVEIRYYYDILCNCQVKLSCSNQS